MTTSIVLASGSATRRAILEAAGLSVIVDLSGIDEAAIKADCRTAGHDAAQTAEMLATAKSCGVASRHPETIVLGADQMLECEGEWFDKPVDRQAAFHQIHRLSGRTHNLFSAVVAIRGGDIVWRTVEHAQLTMRTLSPDFIESYLDMVGDRALSSVGGYQIEGLGIQLFNEIRGDHFTILGLPLLPLLAFLRHERIIGR